MLGCVWMQDNPGYDELFNFYLDNKYQLRYTGGMVPDVNQVNGCSACLRSA